MERLIEAPEADELTRVECLFKELYEKRYTPRNVPKGINHYTPGRIREAGATQIPIMAGAQAIVEAIDEHRQAVLSVAEEIAALRAVFEGKVARVKKKTRAIKTPSVVHGIDELIADLGQGGAS